MTRKHQRCRNCNETCDMLNVQCPGCGSGNLATEARKPETLTETQFLVLRAINDGESPYLADETPRWTKAFMTALDECVKLNLVAFFFAGSCKLTPAGREALAKAKEAK